MEIASLKKVSRKKEHKLGFRYVYYTLDNYGHSIEHRFIYTRANFDKVMLGIKNEKVGKKSK